MEVSLSNDVAKTEKVEMQGVEEEEIDLDALIDEMEDAATQQAEISTKALNNSGKTH